MIGDRYWLLAPKLTQALDVKEPPLTHGMEPVGKRAGVVKASGRKPE